MIKLLQNAECLPVQRFGFLPLAHHSENRRQRAEGFRHVRMIFAEQSAADFKLFQDFLKNPSDVDGIASQMEAAADKAYK